MPGPQLVEFLSSMGFGTKEGEFRYVAMAVGGKLVSPFWVHESDWRRFSDSGQLGSFLLRQALSLLEQYGELSGQTQA